MTSNLSSAASRKRFLLFSDVGKTAADLRASGFTIARRVPDYAVLERGQGGLVWAWDRRGSE